MQAKCDSKSELNDDSVCVTSLDTPTTNIVEVPQTPSLNEYQSIDTGNRSNENRSTNSNNLLSNGRCWSFFHLVFFVISVTLSWWIGHIGMLDDYINYVPSSEDALRRSPFISEKNVTHVLKKRQALVQAEFEEAIVSKKWKVLRSSLNISIETLEAVDGWPPYIRTTAFIACSPETVFEAFKWNNFHKTQSVIDPFYQSSQVIFEGHKGWRVIRKSTKRPLIYPKREFYLATIDTKALKTMNSTLPESMHPPRKESGEGSEKISDPSFEAMLIPKGTMMSVLVSVRMSQDFLDQKQVGSSERARERYVQGFQDFVGWFVPVPGGTRMMLVMRVDVGADIPKWAFFAVVSATGIPAIRSLSKYLNR